MTPLLSKLQRNAGRGAAAKLKHLKLMRLAMQAMQLTQAITQDDDDYNDDDLSDDDEEIRAAALKELKNEVEEVEERGKM